MIFSITNQKGGVGKTTSVMNLGSYMSTLNKKILIVDLDPQSNLTSGLLTNELKEKYNSIYNVLISDLDTKKAIYPTRIDNLFLLPSSIELAGAEVEMVSKVSRENILKKALNKIVNDYDFVIIDCPPSLGLLTVNGLVASEKVLIPVQCEYYALEGLGQLINTVTMVRENLNETLDIGGVILTMYDSRTNLSKDVAKEVRNFFEGKVFDSVIPRSIRLSEAPSRSLTIYEYAPYSSGALAYFNLANEVINRFEGKKSMLRPNIIKD